MIRPIFMAFALSAFSSATGIADATKPSPTIAADCPHITLRGSGKRFAALAQRAEAGESIRVVALGGSITQKADGHSAMIQAWLSTRFPEATIEATNAGLASTCSTSGAFRFQDHVLDGQKLDLLVVEFAVNDDQDAGHPERDCIRGMEGIVVQAQAAGAAVLMIHYVNEGMIKIYHEKSVPVSVSGHEKVAAHYEIPSANVGAEVAEGITDGRYTWKDYGGAHPEKFGYQIATNMAIRILDQMFAKDGATTESQPDKTPQPGLLDPQSYSGGSFVPATDAELAGNHWTTGHPVRESIPEGSLRSDYFSWPMIRATEVGASLSYRFEGRAIGAFVLAGPDAGMVETRIDGGEWKKTDLYGNYSRGLNYPRSVIFATELGKGEHLLELRIAETNNERSKGHAATLLQFEVNK